MIKVTFYVFSKVLNKSFRNVDTFKSLADARLLACAMNWKIEKVEAA